MRCAPDPGGDGGEITIRLAEPSRHIKHLPLVLPSTWSSSNCSRRSVLALVADNVRLQTETNRSLLPDVREDRETLALVLEHISPRFGPERVGQPIVREDHRPEWM